MLGSLNEHTKARRLWTPSRRSAVAWLGAAASVLLAAGCDVPQATAVTQPQQAHSDVYPVAVWYYVRGYVPEDAAAAQSRMAADFGHIRSLGFNTIVADAVQDERRGLLLDTAHAQGLRVVLPHAAGAGYVRTGKLARSTAGGVEALVEANLRQVASHPALLMHYLCDAPTVDMAGRLAELAGLYRSRDPSHSVFVPLSRQVAEIVRQAQLPVVVWDNFPIAEQAPPGRLMNRRYATPTSHADALEAIYAKTAERRHWAIMQAAALPGRLRMPTPAEWDLLHFTALASGFVDGLVFYRYHTDEDPDSGLASPNHMMPPSRLTALRRITQRAEAWGPLLRATQPSAVDVPTEDQRLRAKLLIATKRRFLLVYNPDVQTFAHDVVRLPAMVQGRRVARAVDVDEPKRFLPTGDGSAVPIELRLRPGAGKLYELFGP